MLGMAALAVDYGTWLLQRRSLQNDTDAASLAGVVQLAPSWLCGTAPVRASCARQDAWRALSGSLHLTLDPVALAASNTTTAAPYVEAGYRIWVDTPP